MSTLINKLRKSVTPAMTETLGKSTIEGGDLGLADREHFKRLFEPSMASGILRRNLKRSVTVLDSDVENFESGKPRQNSRIFTTELDPVRKTDPNAVRQGMASMAKRIRNRYSPCEEVVLMTPDVENLYEVLSVLPYYGFLSAQGDRTAQESANAIVHLLSDLYPAEDIHLVLSIVRSEADGKLAIEYFSGFTTEYLQSCITH